MFHFTCGGCERLEEARGGYDAETFTGIPVHRLTVYFRRTKYQLLCNEVSMYSSPVTQRIEPKNIQIYRFKFLVQMTNRLPDWRRSRTLPTPRRGPPGSRRVRYVRGQWKP